MCWMFLALAIVILSNLRVYSSLLSCSSISLKVKQVINESPALKASLVVLDVSLDH